jgi:hypothetical protein
MITPASCCLLLILSGGFAHSATGKSVQPAEIAKIKTAIWLRVDFKWDFDIYMFETACYVKKVRHASEDRPLIYRIANYNYLKSALEQCEESAERRPPFVPPGPSMTILAFDIKSHELEKVHYLDIGDASDAQRKMNSWIKEQIAISRPVSLNPHALDRLVPPDWYKVKR